MRRVLPPADFARWLAGFLPALPRDGRARLAHAGHRHRPDRPQARPPRRPQPEPRLDAGGHRRAACPTRDPRVPARCAPRRPRTATPGLAAVTGEHYEGGHWLGTFAVYLVTGRGLR